ncbi:hypothetical protein PISL3812_01801 [Talaromyces islandicus]|uniref:Uncharacterized protein n=1 Tax=Talaromyces islandicus TaxID=28573 RepID=A0A0U1LNR6_TALIS|nr:hypothetical protein PISL3812_01801 [Talaromyces islandicus]
MDVNDMSVALNSIQDMMMARNEMGFAAHAESDQLLTWTKSRNELLERHQTTRTNTMKSDLQLRSAFVPPAYPPCTFPFKDLTKITLKDLRLQTHHRGLFLIVRCIAPPAQFISVMSIVEDEHGDAIMLTLRHQDISRSQDEILRKGMILAVKEPYPRRMSDGPHGVIVDHVFNYKYLSMKDNLMPGRWQERLPESQDNANSWNTTGKDLAEKEIYTEGLSCRPTEEELRALKLNRSKAYLMTGQLESALHDIESVEKRSKPEHSLLLEKARILYKMQKFREYCDTPKLLAVEDPNNKELKNKLQRGIDRLIEQETGKYPFNKLHDEATKFRPPVLDHATYIGPVAVKSAGHRGRGLFTTKEVKAGDLLLCEKAFGHVFIDELDPNSRKTFLINSQERSVMMGTQVELNTVMIQNLHKRPSSIPVITELHHGSYKPVDASFVNDAPVIDR